MGGITGALYDATVGNFVGPNSFTGKLYDASTGAVSALLKNPLPVIESAALMSVGVPAPIAAASVAAMNGGSIEQIALSAAVAYGASQIGQAAGSAYSPIENQTLQQLGPQYSNELLIKQIVTSSSGAAAATALRGGDLSQILNSAVSSAVAPVIQTELTNQGYDTKSVPSQILTNATAAATKAILSGKSVAEAIANSAAVTGLSAAISSGVDSLKNSQSKIQTLTDQSKKDYNNLQSFYNNNYMNDYWGVTFARSGVQQAVDNYNSTISRGQYLYDWYNSDVEAYNHLVNTGSPNIAADYVPEINRIVDELNGIPQKLETQKASVDAAMGVYDSKNAKFMETSNQYNSMLENYKQYQTQIDALSKDVADQARALGQLTDQYKTTVESAAADYAKQIGDQAAEEAKQALETTAKDAGFPDYTTYEQYAGDASKYQADVAAQKNHDDILNTFRDVLGRDPTPEEYAKFAGENAINISQDLSPIRSARDSVLSELDKSNLTDEEKAAVQTAMQQVYSQSSEAQALPSTVTDVGAAQSRVAYPFAANDPRFVSAMVKNPSLLKSFGEYTNTYGFDSAAGNQVFLNELVKTYSETPPDSQFAKDLKDAMKQVVTATPALLTSDIQNIIEPPLSPIKQEEISTPTVTPVDVTQEEAKKALEDAGITNPTPEQIQELIDQYKQQSGGTTTPTEPTPVTPTPVEPTPVEPTPVEPTPVEPTPVTPEPVTPTPVEPTPVEPTPEPVTPTPEPVTPTPEPVTPEPVTPTPEPVTPVEPTPVTPTPVEPTPVTPTPVEPTPVTPTPVEPTPVTPQALGLTAEDVRSIVSDVMASNPGVTSQQVSDIVNQAIASNPTITAQQVADIVDASVKSSQQSTESMIRNMDANTQAKFDQMTEQQKADVAKLMQSDIDIKSAIDTVASSTAEQIGGVKTALEKQISDVSKQALTPDDVRSIIGDALINHPGVTVDQVTGIVNQAIASNPGMTPDQVSGIVNSAISGLATKEDVTGEAAKQAEQVALLQKQLEEQAAQQKAAADAQAAKDAAAAKAAQAASEKSALQSALGMLAVPGAAAATQAALTETEAPLEHQVAKIKSKGGYQGLLTPFFQEVGTGDYLTDNSTTDNQAGDLMMPTYFNYGSEAPIDQIMAGGDQQTNDESQRPYAMGGAVSPLMGTGTRYGQYASGGMATPLMAAGGKMRVDFRQGDAVTGPGDGQSDDIPAMLADGEFVIPADVVAAIGNGSTKAGSDALYDMMHGIRKHVRSAHHEDLPPEIKSPLDFLKTAPKKGGKKHV